MNRYSDAPFPLRGGRGGLLSSLAGRGGVQTLLLHPRSKRGRRGKSLLHGTALYCAARMGIALHEGLCMAEAGEGREGIITDENRRRERGLVFVVLFCFAGICPDLLCGMVSLPLNLWVGVRVRALSQGPPPGATSRATQARLSGQSLSPSEVTLSPRGPAQPRALSGKFYFLW